MLFPNPFTYISAATPEFHIEAIPPTKPLSRAAKISSLALNT